jgi:hypothetical protein
MIRVRWLIALLFAALVWSSAAVAAQAATSYCSPQTGDFCIGAAKRGGVRYISMTSFAHRGRVRVCINKGTRRDCRRFALRRLRDASGLYEFKVRWSRHFPNRGPGRYRVRFSQAGDQIGPALSFRVGG